MLHPIGLVFAVVGLVFVTGRIVRRLTLGRGHGCGGRRFDGGHGHFRRHGGPGRSFWLRRIFSRLDTTPGQEREIRAAVEDFQKLVRDAKDGARGSREHIAKAISGDQFDDGAFEGASARLDAMTAQAKEAFASALKRIHSVLDPRQRERLASLLAEGPRAFRRGGGPYRDAF